MFSGSLSIVMAREENTAFHCTQREVCSFSAISIFNLKRIANGTVFFVNVNYTVHLFRSYALFCIFRTSILWQSDDKDYQSGRECLVATTLR